MSKLQSQYIDLTNTFVFLGDIEVPTPITGPQAANKAYVDTAVINAASVVPSFFEEEVTYVDVANKSVALTNPSIPSYSQVVVLVIGGSTLDYGDDYTIRKVNTTSYICFDPTSAPASGSFNGGDGSNPSPGIANILQSGEELKVFYSAGGAQGVALGFQGVSGPQGPAGGPQGNAGVQGVVGPQGFQGAPANNPGITASPTGTTTNSFVPFYTSSGGDIAVITSDVQNTGANSLTVHGVVTLFDGTVVTGDIAVGAGLSRNISPSDFGVQGTGEGIASIVLSDKSTTPGSPTTFNAFVRGLNVNVAGPQGNLGPQGFIGVQGNPGAPGGPQGYQGPVGTPGTNSGISSNPTGTTVDALTSIFTYTSASGIAVITFEVLNTGSTHNMTVDISGTFIDGTAIAGYNAVLAPNSLINLGGANFGQDAGTAFASLTLKVQSTTSGLSTTYSAFVRGLETNIAGPQGTVGPQGPFGGPAGVQGAKGVQGSAGTNGTNGVQGAGGTNGVQGATGTGGLLTAYKNADESRANNSTSSADSDLSVNIVSGTKYSFTAILQLTVPSAADLVLNIGGTSTVSNFSCVQNYTCVSGFTTGTEQLTTYPQSTFNTNVSIIGGATTGLYAIVTGGLNCSGSGTLSVNWAQFVSDPSAVVIKAGSNFVVTPL